MKDYNPGKWGMSFIFSFEGSVFPKALACSIPNAILAVGLWYLLRECMSKEVFGDTLSGVAVSQAWSAYNWVIGFGVSFRAQRAYSRWWEGGTLLQQARGEWFNAYSSLIAFCSNDAGKYELVQKFHKIISRLTSMLYASALMSIATENDLDFEIIDASGLSEPHLDYLRTQPDKCEIIMQWIQRLIVDNMDNGVLPIPAPVLSRVFQELSRGIVNIHNVRKITEFQFPFPAAQMIVTLLIIQWCLTPLMAALLMNTPVWAFFVAFFPVFACWGINYIASEIEQPFGTDYNDMPLHFMQASLNTSITSLLDSYAHTPPDFDFSSENTSQLLLAGDRMHAGTYHFSEMRSVRFVTIQGPDQLHKIKHQFIPHHSQTESSGGSGPLRPWAPLSSLASFRGSWRSSSRLSTRSSARPLESLRFGGSSGNAGSSLSTSADSDRGSSASSGYGKSLQVPEKGSLRGPSARLNSTRISPGGSVVEGTAPGKARELGTGALSITPVSPRHPLYRSDSPTSPVSGGASPGMSPCISEEVEHSRNSASHSSEGDDGARSPLTGCQDAFLFHVSPPVSQYNTVPKPAENPPGIVYSGT